MSGRLGIALHTANISTCQEWYGVVLWCMMKPYKVNQARN